VHKKTELANIVLKIVSASAIMGLFIAYFPNFQLITISSVCCSLVFRNTIPCERNQKRRHSAYEVNLATV